MSPSDPVEERFHRLEAVLYYSLDEVANVKRDNAALNQEVANVKRDNAALNEEVANVKHDNAALNQRYDALNHGYYALNQRYAALNHESDVLKHDNAAFKHDNAAIKHDYAVLKHDYAALMHDNANHKQKITDLRGQIDALNRAADEDALVWAPNFVCGVANEILQFWLGKQPRRMTGVTTFQTLYRANDPRYLTLMDRSHVHDIYQMACSLDAVINHRNGLIHADDLGTLYERVLLARSLLDRRRILQRKYPTEAWIIWRFDDFFVY